MRTKAKELVDFIQDDERLREERKKAKKNRDKYIGMSGDSYSSSSRYSKTSSSSASIWHYFTISEKKQHQDQISLKIIGKKFWEIKPFK